MQEQLTWFRESVTGKLIFIGLLVLILLIPIRMIESQVAERGFRADEAARQIAGGWGGQQTIGGPILVLGTEQTKPAYGGRTVALDEVYRLPTQLTIDVVANTQTLNRGIYEVPVYTADVVVSGSFSPLPPGESDEDLVMRWDEAILSIPISDPRSIREPVRIIAGNESASFSAGSERVAGFGRQLIVPLSDLGIETITEPLNFEIAFQIGGTRTLKFLPFGDETTVNLQSDWPSPSFLGSFLPDNRSVSETGFEASWNVLDLGRGYPSTWRRSNVNGHMPTQLPSDSAFGVDMLVPVGIHQTSLRATKYAVLFLSLTFLAYFMFELFTPLRLHAFQYLLVGFANAVFYLLLIAIAEHSGFRVGYFVSAIASVSLITGYSAAVLKTLKRAWPVAALLGSIYGYLYLTLQLEDYALLAGSLGMFAALAAVMYVTRHVDWFNVRFSPPVVAD